ncbi:hypothetical protein ACJ72_02009 [Emergomyces africanus]|uniref:Uncharacterized protein n=1 Tax=Emergomyces africanus TaxID=1955775 RepID=A0A1B7P289_9EURO|nr:hypothetical protein ACJ72_02505 [Emergomyces africanus]OAX83622.1 hypothetical protein ACJ72_02009 [Emergomyces africanus]
MDWLYPFSGLARSSSRASSHRRSRSRDRHSTTSSRHSHSHSHSNGKSHSSPSLFNLGGHANRSTTSSLFSIGSAASSSSRRAKPRSGFIARTVRKIRRLFRHIMRYAQSHPLKVFFMVVMPLITGGVLQKLLAVVGVRLPPSLGGGHGSGFKGGNGGAGLSGILGGGGGGGAGLGESVSGLVSLAKMFV